MPERKHIETALRACAERGVPDATVPWPGIWERSLAGRSRSSRGRRFVPRTRAGLAFAALLVVLFTMGAYAGSRWVFETFQSDLPGGDAAELGERLYLTQTRGYARVNVEWAYADEERVVIGYSVEDLREDRQSTELLPLLAGEDAPPGALPTHIVDLKDGNSNDFLQTNDGENGNYRVVDGTTHVSGPASMLRGPVANTAVFAAPNDLVADGDHRFRLKIPLVVEAIPGKPPTKKEWLAERDRLPGPFYFDFEVPVHPVDTVEMNRKIEANGTAITLDRVVQSRARPEAIICFPLPDDEHEWTPRMDPGLLPFDLRDGYLEVQPVDGMASGCWSVALPEYSDRYSFTVDHLEGAPPDYGRDGWKEIHGPWTFEFDVPER